MQTPSSSYSLPRLAEVADVTPRTIRYYISQGLLPPPVGAGSTTRYTQSHLLRLRLVRELQRQHLPLAEIRARLQRLTDDEVRDLASSMARLEPPGATGASATDYIRTLLAASPAWVTATGRQTPTPPAQPGPPPRAPAAMSVQPSSTTASPPNPRLRATHAVAATYGAAASAPPPPQSARSQWERIVLDPDIELHVRRPLSRIQNRAVDRLVARARELLEEDPK